MESMSWAFRIEDHAQRLQAARGVAALCVTVGHCFITLAHGRIDQPGFELRAATLPLTVGQVLFHQGAAVVFFYVLSGLVLGGSLQRRPALAAFAIRRLWRLLPVMWISIVFALALRAVSVEPHVAGTTSWFDDYFRHELSGREICSDLLGLSWNVNGVLWSVQIELAMILVLPALLKIFRRLPLAGNLVALALLMLGSAPLWGRLPAWANAALYLHCFYAGALLPQLLGADRVRSILSSRALTALAFLAMYAVHLLVMTGRARFELRVIVDALVCTQLLGFILSRPSARAVRILGARPLVWIGDVSYSFYVYSLPIQILIASALLRVFGEPPSPRMATFLIFSIVVGTVGSALLLAAVSHRWIELPCIAAGQRWSRVVEREKPDRKAFASPA